jgi:RimJ/RimL family protein N-acetyltransferase
MSHRCLPRTFQGKNGLPVELHRLADDAGGPLIDMYLTYKPRNSFQGLPPLKDEVCVRWVQDMLRDGIHVVAQAAGTALVGHAALFPINPQKCEMLVVVCPGFQDLGIGTELVRSCVDLAAELDFQRIWLPVEATNVRARHIYRKCGFEYTSNGQGRELDMVCEVQRHRRPPADAKPAVARVPAPCFRFPQVSQPLAQDA